MLLALPGSGEELFKSFKSKLRSQIRRPQKEGMKTIIGGLEILDHFYRVFAANMRDLGSPVHSKKLFGQIFQAFGENVKIGVVYCQNGPVAAGLIVCFRDIVEIPWASSLRGYNRFSPNMLLYWSLLEHASDKDYRRFDFGRSTPGKGAYGFKKQWGAEPYPLYWYIYGLSRYETLASMNESMAMSRAVALWQRLPLFLANLIGPRIRASISL